MQVIKMKRSSHPGSNEAGRLQILNWRYADEAEQDGYVQYRSHYPIDPHQNDIENNVQCCTLHDGDVE